MTLLESYGKFHAYSGTFFTLIVGIAFIIIGIFLIYKSVTTVRRTSIVATVTGQHCYAVKHDQKCDIQVSYALNGQNYVGVLVGVQPTAIDAKRTIYIDLSNPMIPYDTDGKDFVLGSILIICGFVIIPISIMWSKKVHDNPEMARLSGYAGIASNIF